MTSNALVNYQPPAEQNRRLVLQVLRQHRQLSRRQISELTGLRGSTLTYVVRDLMESSVLRTAGKRCSGTAGPKQILLEINPAYGYAAGFELGRNTALMVICDAAGQTIDASEIPTNLRLDQLPALLRNALDDRLSSLHLPAADRLLGVGFGVPGIIDTQQGLLVHSTVLNVRNFPLRQMLSLAFESPVLVVDHDANYAAVAEARWGAAQGLHHFIYYFMNYATSRDQSAFRSFGAALFLGGQLYHGAHFGAGEINCNLMPRLETPMTQQDCVCLQESQAALTPFLEAMAREVGRSLASIVGLLDPHGVIVGSNLSINNERFIQAIRQTVGRQVEPVQQSSVKIAASALGREAVALGAALAATVAADNLVIRNGAGQAT